MFYPLDLMIMALCCSFTLDLSITAERTFVPVAGFCGHKNYFDCIFRISPYLFEGCLQKQQQFDNNGCSDATAGEVCVVQCSTLFSALG